MKIEEKGHVYLLDHIDADDRSHSTLTFVNREDNPHGGTQTQEVLRALIDRTQHCHACLPHDVNAKIIKHLRLALVLHEARALERKVEKGILAPELVSTFVDGHFKLDGHVCTQNSND